MSPDLTLLLCWAKSIVEGSVAGTPPPNPHLEAITSVFGLSEFEHALLAFAACLEIDGSITTALPGKRLTVGYALDRLPNSHWDAFAPANPMRRWGLARVESEDGFAQATVRIEEAVLLAILGSSGLDEALLQYFHPVPNESFATPRFDRVARELAAAWQEKSVLANLTGPDVEPQEWIFSAASKELNLNAWRLDSRAIPATVEGQFHLAKDWTRYAAIHGASLLIAAHEEISNVKAFATYLKTPCVIASADRIEMDEVGHFDVAPLSSHERAEYWKGALGNQVEALNGKFHQMVEQFDVPLNRLNEVVRTARNRTDTFEETLWSEAKSASRRRLDELAQRIDPVATWDDLVLPQDQKTALRELVAQVRQRSIVHHDWGFGDKIARGLGIAALFHGASGTGKTLSAEVVAHELDLDLFRIDLSSVVSKYIGETEKNLKKLFDAAERCGAVLLFDEADALFGKRTEVKDSHDRYANIEVGYLLQRMESYRGIAILTTNMKEAFDPAFLRRLRFIVSFPFPGPVERKEIWRKCLPGKAPLAGVDFDKLAQLNVSGGHIRNISLSAAFLAADQGSKIGMAHFRAAAKTEFSKLDRPLLDSEVAGWV